MQSLAYSVIQKSTKLQFATDIFQLFICLPPAEKTTVNKISKIIVHIKNRTTKTMGAGRLGLYVPIHLYSVNTTSDVVLETAVLVSRPLETVFWRSWSWSRRIGLEYFSRTVMQRRCQQALQLSYCRRAVSTSCQPI